MARDMKQVIENTRNQPKPLKRWARRQHDAKGVSNFHLDRDDQIVRTKDRREGLTDAAIMLCKLNKSL